jgi:hypothetical protein
MPRERPKNSSSDAQRAKFANAEKPNGGGGHLGFEAQLFLAADRVPVEKRGVFLDRVVARLQLYRGFTDADLDDAVHAALTGLIQSAA